MTAEQVLELQVRLENCFRIKRTQVLELAGFGLGAVARHLLDDDALDRPVVVLVGSGDKACAGLVAARHLHNWGAWVQVISSERENGRTGQAPPQLAALEEMGVPLSWAEEGWELPPCDIVLDAVMDTQLTGEPTGLARNLIELANSSLAPVVSFDVPSGVEPQTGAQSDVFIQAAATVCMALPRASILVPPGNLVCGQLFLVDIGAPLALFHQLGIDLPPIFRRGAFLRAESVNGLVRVVEP